MFIEGGFNPASMTMLIPNNGLGIMFPWAGAAAGTAFATGYLDLRERIKIGTVATVFHVVITASTHSLFSPPSVTGTTWPTRTGLAGPALTAPLLFAKL